MFTDAMDVPTNHDFKVKELRSKVPAEMRPSLKEMVKLASRVNSNSYGLGDPNEASNADVAFGLFPVASFMNHSCHPNSVFTGSSHGVMVVKALRPIKAGDEILVSYIDIFQPTQERRHDLLTTKHFWCLCDRCVAASLPRNAHSPVADDFLQGVLCEKCHSGIYLERPDQSSAVCHECAHHIPLAQFHDMNLFLEQEFDAAFYFMRQGHFGFARSALERFLSLYVPSLPNNKTFTRNSHTPSPTAPKMHLHHHLVLNALIPLLNCCPVFGDLEESIELHRIVLHIMQSSLVWQGMKSATEIVDFQESFGDVIMLQVNELEKEGQEKGLIMDLLKEGREAYSSAYEGRKAISGKQPKTLQVRSKLSNLVGKMLPSKI
jgi:SET and MYND domain-containing protein